VLPIDVLKMRRATATTPATPPTISAVGSESAATVSPATPGLPTGTAENDILILLCEVNPSTTVDTPTGWTAFAGMPLSTSGFESTRLYAFWKRAGASEAAPSVTFSANHCIARIIGVSGCVTTGSPFEQISTNTGGASFSHSVTGFTTVADNQLVLDMVSCGEDFSGSEFGGWSNASLTGFGEIMDHSSAAGDGGSLGAARGTMATAGVVSSTSFTTASSRPVCCIKVSLLPA
jgi:hypothetical protein